MTHNRGYYDVFVRTCAKYPSNVAVRHYVNEEYKTYTYSELYGVCEYIAQNLQQLQCNRGIIGLVSERNIIIPCVIAAAHKCCTTFMFLDPSQNLADVANNTKFTVIITIMDQDANNLVLDSQCKKPDRTVTVFNLIISFFNYDTTGSQHSYRQAQYSFIAMTSGSTGDPKQIEVPVQCIQPNISDLTRLFHITPSDVIYFSTPLTFDPSMIEILLACINGASLLIAPERVEVLFPANKHNAITVWQTTPSKFFLHSNANIRDKILSANSALRILALGGEPMNGVKKLRELKDCNNKTRIFTLYGVTEMSCWACVAELDMLRSLTDKEIPLGNCLSQTDIVVQPDPEEENKNVGKIVLVSKTRQCIILNKPSYSEQIDSLKFVETGDFGEVKNGTIYYRGRKDDVIKRFGHKINLQFIECVVMQCPRVKTCSCVWLPKPKLLVVYYSSEIFSSKELSDFLKCKLDDKHWPDKIIRVDNMPMNRHGKISKVTLAELYEKPTTPTKIVPTINSLKVKFLQELKFTLKSNFTYDDIKDKDFFAIGGTSFLAVILCNRIAITYPRFGNFLLPHLMTQRYDIDEIMQLAANEMGIIEAPKCKKKLKRSVVLSEVNSEHTVKRSVTSRDSPVEFVVLWNYDTGKCVDASPTLWQTAFNLYVSVGSHSGKIVVVNALSGESLGTINVNSRIEAAVYCYQADSLQPPCGVVGAHDGTVVCFDLDNCQEKWRTNVGATIKSKATSTNGFLYIASYDGCIRCIDLMTGAIKNAISIAEQAISADLVLAKNQYVLTGTLSGVCASVLTTNNTVAWRGTVGSPVFASPVLYDNDKYVVFAEVNGEIHCRTVEKGIKIWRYQGAKGNIFSSIYIKQIEKLKWQMVFGCHDSKVYSIIVKNFQPSLHWKTQLTAPVYATPSGLNDKLMLAASNNGKICIIEFDHGMIAAEYQLPGETFSSPAVYEDYIFIGCRNDHLYSLRYVLNF